MHVGGMVRKWAALDVKWPALEFEIPCPSIKIRGAVRKAEFENDMEWR